MEIVSGDRCWSWNILTVWVQSLTETKMINVLLTWWDFRFLWQRIRRSVAWNVAPCSLVNINRRFREAYRLYHQGREMYADNASSNLLWNVRWCVRDYVSQHNRRQSVIFIRINFSSLFVGRYFWISKLDVLHISSAHSLSFIFYHSVCSYVYGVDEASLNELTRSNSIANTFFKS
jgi:hypothetical protein